MVLSADVLASAELGHSYRIPAVQAPIACHAGSTQTQTTVTTKDEYIRALVRDLLAGWAHSGIAFESSEGRGCPGPALAFRLATRAADLVFPEEGDSVPF